jgi:hypothetical protein
LRHHRHVQELVPGLYRWTARHPDWEPGAAADSPGDWPEEVGSVAYCNEETLVLVDPLVPDELWPRLDELARDRRVHVLTTIGWHRRSRDAVVERYGAETSRAKPNLPPGVVTITLRGAGETLVWLPEPRALVVGDRILADGGGALRLCPDSWLRYLSSGITRAELRGLLQPLLDLPVELVLVSHGEPVLHDGRAALERALAS